MNPPPPSSKPRSGLYMALGAYVIWGLFPLYLRLISEISPWHVVGWRIIFTVPVCLLFAAVMRQLADVRAVLRQPRTLVTLALSALLVGGNWVVYIAAINHGHVFAASIGYYINPLANVLLGTVFLRERLSKLQWLAVAMATIGVSVLAWDARDMLWISLTLAGSFACYGLVRKLVPVGALAGLTVESLVLLPPALAILWLTGANPAIAPSPVTAGLVAAFGVLTAVPLLLFAGAARRLDYSTLGFVQYVAPTLVFFQGLFVFHEPLKQTQLVCFITIWAAIAVFSWDLWARRSKA